MPPRKIQLWIIGAAFVLVFLSASFCRSDTREFSNERKNLMTLHLTSAAFDEGAPIPSKYTCEGDDVSPPLKWNSISEKTKSFALICDDPDAPVGTWVHWVLYNIPPSVTEFSEKVPITEMLPNGGRQGRNDFKRAGYGGPCPPRGKPHRYFFKLYALDTELSLKSGAAKGDLVDAMKGHVLAEGQLMGTYQRK